jgi:hypothetical protein
MPGKGGRDRKTQLEKEAEDALRHKAKTNIPTWAQNTFFDAGNIKPAKTPSLEPSGHYHRPSNGKWYQSKDASEQLMWGAADEKVAISFSGGICSLYPMQ